MRRLLLLAALAVGCDFTPSPPAPAIAASAPAAPAPPDAAAIDSVRLDCIAIADHLVDLATAAVASDSERAVQTANHARNVRATAETCTKGAWTPALLTCLGAATTQAAAGACMQAR